MKKFGQILTVAICLTVALVGCIKEESYKVEKALFTVDLTRGATSTQEQGDRIEDVMIWAFKCTLDDTTGGVKSVQEGPATGWRYQQNLNTYQNISLHVELPICDGEQDYLVIAVLNTQAFGKLSSTSVDNTFGSTTTYEQLRSMVFDAKGAAFWQTYPNDAGKTPDLMPISNWKTMTIKSSNTHPDNCYHMSMPVYRAVAKAQLYMNASSDKFAVNVTGAKIISKSAPINGGVFTGNAKTVDGSNGEKSMQGNSDETVTIPQPLGTLTNGAVEKPLWNTSTNAWSNVTVNTVAQSGNAASDPYTWVGSTFLYENAAALTETGYDTLPTSNGGYYMQVEYDVTVSDKTESHTKYVPLPATVRNHDYTVKATVEQAVNGHLVINYVVTEWETKTIDVPPFN
jgi:hypothetical protein